MSVHAIMVNIHLLVACGILPEYYCTDASLRRYAMLIVALRISSGRAEWLIDIIIVKKLNSLKHLVRTTVAESHN